MLGLSPRSCSICGSNNAEEVYEQPTGSIAGLGDIGYVHRILICKQCGFVFASPILPEETILRYYASLSNYETLPTSEDQSKFKRSYEFIKSRFPLDFRGKALDIGSAVAYELSLLQQDGWEVTGLDPSPRCAELSRELYGVQVITGIFDKDVLIGRKPYDLVILSHVLEHVISPDLLVTDVSGLLSKTGLVYVEVPNLLRPWVPMGYFAFEHLNYFTPTTLTSLMESRGFSVDNLQTFDNSSSISPFYPVIASTWKVSGESHPVSRSDYAAAYTTIKNYSEESKREIERLQSRIGFIVSRTKQGRLGLWGAGIHTSELFCMTSLSRANLACIFDNDPKKVGTHVNGIEVVTFSGRPEQVRSLVDAIVISSKASENQIYNQIRYLKEHGIQIYKLYDV
jgi:SAM-dependent methyltransferase